MRKWFVLSGMLILAAAVLVAPTALTALPSGLCSICLLGAGPQPPTPTPPGPPRCYLPLVVRRGCRASLHGPGAGAPTIPIPMPRPLLLPATEGQQNGRGTPTGIGSIFAPGLDAEPDAGRPEWVPTWTSTSTATLRGGPSPHPSRLDRTRVSPSPAWSPEPTTSWFSPPGGADRTPSRRRWRDGPGTSIHRVHHRPAAAAPAYCGHHCFRSEHLCKVGNRSGGVGGGPPRRFHPGASRGLSRRFSARYALQGFGLNPNSAYVEVAAQGGWNRGQQVVVRVCYNVPPPPVPYGDRLLPSRICSRQTMPVYQWKARW